MTERRGRKELVELDRTLGSVEDIVPKVRADLLDLEGLAWEQAVAEQQERRSRKQGWALTDIGDPRAKQALRELDRTAAAFLSAAQKTRNLFVGGPGPSRVTTSSDLGEGPQGHGAAAELRRLQEAQQRRRERGDYVPNRIEIQPHVPGSRSR